MAVGELRGKVLRQIKPTCGGLAGTAGLLGNFPRPVALVKCDGRVNLLPPTVGRSKRGEGRGLCAHLASRLELLPQQQPLRGDKESPTQGVYNLHGSTLTPKIPQNIHSRVDPDTENTQLAVHSTVNINVSLQILDTES